MRFEDIKNVMESGVVFACASCDKFWWGVSNGVDECKASAENKPCGGPLSGMAYPQYSGPLDGNLHMFCFVCGAKGDAGIDVNGLGVVGVCEDHIPVIETFSKPGERPAFVSHVTLPVLE